MSILYFDSYPSKSAIKVTLRIPGEDTAIKTSVVPLGKGQYRLEDPWYGYFLNLDDNDEPVGGLEFRDVFLAERLADGSLQFGQLLRKGKWRVLNLFLGSYIISPRLKPAFLRIEEHGGFALEDPIAAGEVLIFLPPETDHDPTDDIESAIKTIPREEVLKDFETWRKHWGQPDKEST